VNAFYIINILIYAAVDAMACLGLNQQFGVAGVTNFGFIIFQAAGGYAAAILALPPATANGGFQSYIGGWGLPFPLPWIGAAYPPAAWKMMKPKLVTPATPNCWFRPRQAMASTAA